MTIKGPAVRSVGLFRYCPNENAMLKKKIYILLLFTIPLFAQKEGANWYFGSEAGLNFNSGSPVAVSNGALSTNEGCAAISTPNGVLQFYTDGITVYNSNHYPMPNGSDLMGHPSSTQSAIVIPAPMDFGRYYIFTVDYQAYPNGLRYTKVDMSLNGGLGDVVVSEKNIPLHTPVAEKISAVYHENLEDIWVISHGINNNEYLAYLVTSEGVTTTPVTSAVGEVHTCSMVPGSTGTIGYLKFSPDGKKLACAISDENVGLELLDFEPATGAVSNSRKIYNAAAYGLEFSPAGNLLYFTKSNNLVPVEVMQCDITLPTLASIQASMTTISFENAGALQLGIDGKIYVANPATTYLGVIHNPNSQGVDCNFESAGVSLGGKTCNLGLPNFFQSFFLQAIRTEDICLGNSAAFLIRSPVEPTSAFWTFGDGETSNSISPQHTYSEAGTYTVTVDLTTAVHDGTITLVREITVFAIPEATEPADMLVCEQAFDGVAEFNLALQSPVILAQQSPADHIVTYHTSHQLAENGEDAIITLFTNTQNPQTIYARVAGEGDCYSITSFDVIVGAIPAITNPDGLVACEEERGSGLGSFDLTQAIAQITGGNDDLAVTFYSTPEDIPAGLQITAPETYSNTTPYNQTVYFKVVNADTPECDVTGQLALVLDPLPELNAAVVDHLLCDEQNNGDGYEVFDLSSHYNAITTEPGLNLTYSYEQDGDMIIIDDPTAFQNTVAGGQVIYVSAQNIYGCESVTNFVIKVVPLPAVQDPGPFYACEDQPGLGNYDLLDIAVALTGSQGNVSVSYYASLDEAALGDDATAL
ncbi:PKD domain-containing protein, partial [Flavobacterium sp.]